MRKTDDRQQLLLSALPKPDGHPFLFSLDFLPSVFPPFAGPIPWWCKLKVPLMTTVAPLEISSAHSPDSDDAFMFYALATKKVRSSRVTFRHVLSDIETLNRKAMEGVYDLSAISYHAYPYVADKYVLMASGSSIGDGYGPMIIANRPMEPEESKASASRSRVP